MILGVLVALSRYLFPKYDQALLIGGIGLLMIGIYRISRNLPSKNEEDFQDPATKIRNPEDEWRMTNNKWRMTFCVSKMGQLRNLQIKLI